MRVVILAFDGLDYRYATKFKTLRQREYYIIDLEGLPIVTSLLFATFITGSKTAHGIKAGDNQKLARIPKHVKTIFDYAKKPCALWIPSLNPHPKYWHPKHVQLMVKARAGDKSALTHFIKEIMLLWHEQTTTFLNEVKKDYDLIMAHFNLIDALSHALRNDKALLKYYVLVSKFVENVKQHITDDDYLIIISDHGHEHQPYAFYSCNHVLFGRQPKITEFFNKIVSILSK